MEIHRVEAPPLRALEIELYATGRRLRLCRIAMLVLAVLTVVSQLLDRPWLAFFAWSWTCISALQLLAEVLPNLRNAHELGCPAWRIVRLALCGWTGAFPYRRRLPP